jgi:hypothetical protein
VYKKRYKKASTTKVRRKKTMVNKKIWLGILVMVLVFGMTVVGCDDGSNNNNNNDDDPDPSTQTPLTGTVTVSSDVTINTINGKETMKLTADISGLNGDSLYYFYQWMKDGVNISGASSSTYDVTEADYGKTVRVKVTSSVLSGEKFGEIAVPSPTICTVSVKYAGTTNSAGRKRVFFERTDGTSLGNTTTSLGTTVETVTLTSWNVNKFKMRIDYTFGITDPVKYYFKKPSTTVEEFDLTGGTKSYTLTYDYDTGALGYYSNLVATEE